MCVRLGTIRVHSVVVAYRSDFSVFCLINIRVTWTRWTLLRTTTWVVWNKDNRIFQGLGELIVSVAIYHASPGKRACSNWTEGYIVQVICWGNSGYGWTCKTLLWKYNYISFIWYSLAKWLLFPTGRWEYFLIYNFDNAIYLLGSWSIDYRTMPRALFPWEARSSWWCFSQVCSGATSLS